MSRKIHNNSICLCGSGQKYKQCCGKNIGVSPNISMYISDKKSDASDFEKEVYNKIGFYPTDFINPIKKLSDVIYVLIDESCIKDYYSVSGTVILQSEIDKNLEVQSSLNKLTEKYSVDFIHFNEIFGRKNCFGKDRKNFIKEYSDIVNKLKIKPFTICMTKKEISNWLKNETITTEECYIALTWKLMFNILIYCTYTYGNTLIIEMWRENDNVTNDKRILHQINCSELIKQFPFANISIYKDYLLFMKSKVLFSSITDLIAYTTTKIFSKIDTSIPVSKIVRDNKDLLVLFKSTFKDTTYMKNEAFTKLLQDLEMEV